MGSGFSTNTAMALDALPLAAKEELQASFATMLAAKITLPATNSTGVVKPTMPTFPCEFPMNVIRWLTFEKLGYLPRSDEAASRGLLEEHVATSTCIFVSHSWWDRTGAQAAPDFTSGDQKHLKFEVVCRGVRGLITDQGVDPAKLTVWLDWFSIDQLDEVRKAAGVKSMISYVTRSTFMLIPVPTVQVVSHDFEEGDDPEEHGAYYPEDVAVYGSRGWCRLEYFVFGLFSEISIGETLKGKNFEGDLPPLKLYAVGANGELKHFKVVEFLGGDRGDFPSQGEFSFDSDRAAIKQLEERMMSSFGFAVVRNAVAVAAAAAEGASCTIDIGAKMLHDEHLQALAAAAAAGSLVKVTSLSFNANPHMKALPELTKMPKLRQLSLINCSSLTTIGSLAALPSLQVVKLEGCTSLAALPKLPHANAKWDDDDASFSFLAPQHLRIGIRVESGG